MRSTTGRPSQRPRRSSRPIRRGSRKMPPPTPISVNHTAWGASQRVWTWAGMRGASTGALRGLDSLDIAPGYSPLRPAAGGGGTGAPAPPGRRGGGGGGGPRLELLLVAAPVVPGTPLARHAPRRVVLVHEVHVGVARQLLGEE